MSRVPSTFLAALLALALPGAAAAGPRAPAPRPALVERGYTGRLARVASADSFVPLGPAAGLVLVDEDEIADAARGLLA